MKTTRVRRKISPVPTLKENSGDSTVPTPSKKKYFVILLVLIIVIGLLYYFKSFLIAAIVNGQPITRFALMGELDKRFGKKTLDTLVTKTLILQEAKKQNITVSKEELDKKVKEIEDSLTKQGQNLNQLLDSQGMTMEDLKEEVKIQLILEKIAGKDIKVTDQEVDKYIEDNKSMLPKDSKIEDVKDNVRKQLEQDKLGEKAASILKQLRDSAKINYLK